MPKIEKAYMKLMRNPEIEQPNIKIHSQMAIPNLQIETYQVEAITKAKIKKTKLKDLKTHPSKGIERPKFH